MPTATPRAGRPFLSNSFDTPARFLMPPEGQPSRSEPFRRLWPSRSARAPACVPDWSNRPSIEKTPADRARLPPPHVGPGLSPATCRPRRPEDQKPQANSTSESLHGDLPVSNLPRRTRAASPLASRQSRHLFSRVELLEDKPIVHPDRASDSSFPRRSRVDRQSPPHRESTTCWRIRLPPFALGFAGTRIAKAAVVRSAPGTTAVRVSPFCPDTLDSRRHSKIPMPNRPQRPSNPTWKQSLVPGAPEPRPNFRGGCVSSRPRDIPKMCKCPVATPPQEGRQGPKPAWFPRTPLQPPPFPETAFRPLPGPPPADLRLAGPPPLAEPT